MSKKILPLFLALAILCSLCSCGNTSASDATASESTDSEYADESNVTNASETDSLDETDSDENTDSADSSILDSSDEYTLTYAGTFSEGLAWIRFEDDSTAYTGCIDKSGNLLFYYASSYFCTEFENGYSYLITSEFPVFRVDTEGNVVSSFSPTSYTTYGYSSSNTLDQSTGIIAWGGGYVLYQEFESGFDQSPTFTYSVLDEDGNTLYDFTYESEQSIYGVYYLGDGVFSFTFDTYNVGVSTFYFTETDTVVEHQVSYDYLTTANVPIDNGYFVFFCGSYSDDTFISIGDVQGNVWDVLIPSEYGTDPEVLGISDGYVLLKDGENFYYLYNIETDTFSKYEGEYTDNLNWESADIGNGVIALSLEGQDGEQYIGLFNTDWEAICEPFRGGSFEIEDNVLVVTDKLGMSYCRVYDLDGNLLSSFSGDSSLDYFGEGLFVKDSESYYYPDGSQPFTEINFSSGTMLSLS